MILWKNFPSIIESTCYERVPPTPIRRIKATIMNIVMVMVHLVTAAKKADAIDVVVSWRRMRNCERNRLRNILPLLTRLLLIGLKDEIPVIKSFPTKGRRWFT